MAGEIPQWAYERVSRLQDDFSGASYYVSLSASYADLKGAFALYISQHEEPPVDPLEEELGKEADRFMRVDQPTRYIVLAALKRGIEIGKSNA